MRLEFAGKIIVELSEGIDFRVKQRGGVTHLVIDFKEKEERDTQVAVSANTKRKISPKLSEEEKAEIVRKYEAGTSTSYLVKRYSSTRAHIRKVLVEAGVELRDERKDGKPRTEKLKKAEKDAIDHLHCMGMTPKEIAKEMSLNLSQIQYYLKTSNML